MCIVSLRATNIKGGEKNGIKIKSYKAEKSERQKKKNNKNNENSNKCGRY